MFEVIRAGATSFFHKFEEYKIRERITEVALRILETIEYGYLALVSFGRRVRIGCYESLARLVGLLILPISILYSEKERAEFKRQAEERIQAVNSSTTSVAQKIQLDKQEGISLTHPRATNPMRATTIHFLSNNELWQQALPALVEYHQQTGSDLLCYNWQPFAKTDEELVHNGVAQVKELLTSGILPEKIVLSGYDFGAAIAAQVAAKLESEGISVNLVSENSFSSLEEVIKQRFRYTARMVSSLVSYFQWKLDPQAVLPTLRGTLIVKDHNRGSIPTFKKAVEKATQLSLKRVIHITSNEELYTSVKTLLY